MAGQANSTLYHKIESSEGMGDSFYVRGFRKVTNYFICLSFISLFPSNSSSHIFPWPLFCLSTFILSPQSPFIPTFLFLFLTLHVSPSSSTCSPALLHQQAQPASQQWASGCPSQQRPSACDAHPRLPGRPWLPNDDDPWATVALPQLTTGSCLLHTGTGRGCTDRGLSDACQIFFLFKPDGVHHQISHCYHLCHVVVLFLFESIL